MYSNTLSMTDMYSCLCQQRDNSPEVLGLLIKTVDQQIILLCENEKKSEF